jgi:hypothetical protein
MPSSWELLQCLILPSYTAYLPAELKGLVVVHLGQSGTWYGFFARTYVKHGPHPGGGKCDWFLKKILCVSPKAGLAQPTANFVHNLCLVSHYFVIYWTLHDDIMYDIISS